MSVVLAEAYKEANEIWPKALPSLTRAEAARAARKLTMRFLENAKRRPGTSPRVRKCWVALKPPTSSLHRGWRRLVHDVSHEVFSRDNRMARSHSGWHGELEAAMARYVIEQGWLTGTLKLKPPVKPGLEARRTARTLNAIEMVAKWERKAKLAATKLKRWRRRARELERRFKLPVEVAQP